MLEKKSPTGIRPPADGARAMAKGPSSPGRPVLPPAEGAMVRASSRPVARESGPASALAKETGAPSKEQRSTATLFLVTPKGEISA